MSDSRNIQEDKSIRKDKNVQDSNILIMDRSSIPLELIDAGVEFIKLDKSIAKKGIPPEDIEKIVVAIKNLQYY